MKKLQSIIVHISISCLLLTGCSKSGTNVNVNRIIKSSAIIVSEKSEETKDDFILTIWNNNMDKSYIEQLFTSMYPKAKVNIVKIEGMDSANIIKALASKDAPDIVISYSDKIGSFNAIDGFEDLSQSKYNVKDIKFLFNQRELDQCMSLDGKKLIALPFTTSPMVTYYRKDILEQHGIPTTPNELGDFMEKPESWLTMAKELKKDNKYVLQWKDELVKIALTAYGYFDQDMNLKVDSEKVKETLELDKETYDLGLMGNYDIWTEEGKKAVKDGKIAMLYLNKWGGDYIKEIAPETVGKWGATRLPLGIYGYSGLNNISISSSSKYKMQAWKLVKKLIEDDRNYYESMRNEKDEFFGGQKCKLLYQELSNKLPRKYPTMLDDKVNSIFINSINNNLKSESNIDSILALTKLQITNSIFREQQILSEYIKQNRNP